MSQSSFRRSSSFLDKVLSEADLALKVLSGSVTAQRPNPAGPANADVVPPAAVGEAAAPGQLSSADARHAAALMRVNHVGEICAQALYRGQAATSKKPATQMLLLRAAEEETDHLAWLAQRLTELRSRTSLLNPLWYAGSFGIGMVAGKAGEAMNLGFMAETERQVERHLDGHLGSLPAGDARSRAIVEKMCADERQHRVSAELGGGMPMPAPVRTAMRLASKVMTSTAYYI